MASLVSYGVCQTVCNVAVVSCYGTAGLTFGTITGGVGAPAAALACNGLLGTCMSACATKFLAEGAAETAATGGMLGPVVAVGGVVLGIGGAVAATTAAGGGAAAASAGAATAAGAAEVAGAGAVAGAVGVRVALGVLLGVGMLGAVATAGTLGWWAYSRANMEDQKPEEEPAPPRFPENIIVTAAETFPGARGRVLNITRGMVNVDWGADIGVREMPDASLTIADGGEITIPAASPAMATGPLRRAVVVENTSGCSVTFVSYKASDKLQWLCHCSQQCDHGSNIGISGHPEFRVHTYQGDSQLTARVSNGNGFKVAIGKHYVWDGRFIMEKLAVDSLRVGRH